MYKSTLVFALCELWMESIAELWLTILNMFFSMLTAHTDIYV